MVRDLIYILMFLGMLTLQGCLGMGQPIKPLMPSLPENFSAVPKGSAVDISRLKISATLLDLVDDDKARHMITETLANNPDLKATALRLNAAGLLLSQTGANRLPQVDAGYSGSRNNQTFNREVQGNHRISMGLSWELDLWGKLADRHSAQKKAFEGLKLTYYRAMDSLAARVLQTGFSAKANQLTLNVLQRRVDLYLKIEQTILDRYHAGIGTLDEMAAARTKTYVARSNLIHTQQIFQSTLRELEVLMGRYPRAEVDLPDRLPSVDLQKPCVPASILTHRADVQAAGKRYESAVKDARASHKELLPGISLSADIFRDNARLSKLSSTPNAWGVVGSLLFPVFNAGRLRNTASAAEAQAQAAYEEYSGTVIMAMKEAENAFSKEQSLKDRLTQLVNAQKQAHQSRQYYQDRFREGMDDIVMLHSAIDQELDILTSIIDVKAERLINRIDLALALGSGTLERTEQ